MLFPGRGGMLNLNKSPRISLPNVLPLGKLHGQVKVINFSVFGIVSPAPNIFNVSSFKYFKMHSFLGFNIRRYCILRILQFANLPCLASPGSHHTKECLGLVPFTLEVKG